MKNVTARFVSLQAIAGLIVLVAVLALLTGLITALAQPAWLGSVGQVGAMVVGAVAFLLLVALSLTIRAILAIEENTRAAAEALEALVAAGGWRPPEPVAAADTQEGVAGSVGAGE